MPKNNAERWRSLMRPRSVGRRKIVGIGLIAISVLAFATPLAAGTWSLQLSMQERGEGQELADERR